MTVVSGELGFAVTVETQPGTHELVFEEKTFRGEMLSNRQITKQGEQVVPGLVLANKISIIGTEYVFDNAARLVYVKLRNVAWSISSIEIKHPRLYLTLGTTYNENIK